MFQIRNYVTHGLVAGALTSAALLPVPAAEAATESVVYSFCSQGGINTNCTDGEGPIAGLINLNGSLYGTTDQGGANDGGTVFKVNPTNGTETVLYSFCSQASCTDGNSPEAGLINVSGTLYGTTQGGGTNGNGTVFKVNPTNGAETVLYSFQGGTDGGDPVAALINVNGTIYGTTYGGGTGTGCYANGGCGTVFKVNPKTGAETVVYSFRGGSSDGGNPWAGLINVSGTIYGTTVYGNGTGCGGLNLGCGTVFKVNPKTGAEAVVYPFCSQGGINSNCTDGANPYADLINVGGTIYGTTTQGGAGNCNPLGCGTVFKVNPKTGAETVVYSFQGGSSDGDTPRGGLINVGGTLYGTTVLGGANCEMGDNVGCGTVFKVNPTNGAETVLYSFCSQNGCTDGEFPYADLINVSGTLYGTTYWGGGSANCTDANCGTVFKVTLP